MTVGTFAGMIEDLAVAIEPTGLALVKGLAKRKNSKETEQNSKDQTHSSNFAFAKKALLGKASG